MANYILAIASVSSEETIVRLLQECQGVDLVGLPLWPAMRVGAGVSRRWLRNVIGRVLNLKFDNCEPSNAKHQFLSQVGELLHRYGTPSHRLERVMTQLAGSLGVKGVFLYTPTALIFSITDEQGESTYLIRVDSGAVDVDKLIAFDETLECLEGGSLSLAQASQRLDEIAARQPPYPFWLTLSACAVACAAVAVFLGGRPQEIVVAGVLGLLVTLLELIPAKLGWEKGLIESLSGLVAAAGSLATAHFLVPIDDRLVTLAALIVMIPGLPITIALTELAVGHLSAGVARLAGACVTLLSATIGVALGWRLVGNLRQLPVMDEAWQPPFWWAWVAIACAPLCFAIVFRARWPLWPIITAVSVAGFVASTSAGAVFGMEVGAFCGALAVGVGSNLYARLRDRPAMVPLTPGIIILVPGSLGYRSLTAFLDNETVVGIDFAFNMLMVAAALVGGVLTSNAILPPKRIL